MNRQSIIMDPYFDSIFERMFINSYSGESVSFSDVEELSSQITNYEQQSNMKLFIYKSCISNPQRKGYRQYKCALHRNCNFVVFFGKKDDGTIILKRKNLYHNHE